MASAKAAQKVVRAAAAKGRATAETLPDLRHTCATLLPARNVHPKYFQELLGHATVAITLAKYSHLLPGMGSHTTSAMEDVFS